MKFAKNWCGEKKKVAVYNNRKLHHTNRLINKGAAKKKWLYAVLCGVK